VGGREQALIGTPNDKGTITNGLPRAIKKYNRNERRSFKNYAAEAMRWAMQEFLRQNPTHKSLNDERYKDDDGRPITWLESVVDVDDGAETNERRLASIMNAVSGLDPVVQNIFLARHRFADKRPTLHQLGLRFDRSHEGIRRALLKAEDFVRRGCEKWADENY